MKKFKVRVCDTGCGHHWRCLKCWFNDIISFFERVNERYFHVYWLKEWWGEFITVKLPLWKKLTFFPLALMILPLYFWDFIFKKPYKFRGVDGVD